MTVLGKTAWVVGATLVALLGVAASDPAAGQEPTGRVVGITDGDTLKVVVAGIEVTVRLWGVDAPETGDAYSNRAKQHLSSLTFGRDVTLDQQDTDRYGRIVARVSVEGADIGQAMVREGLAWHYASFSDNDPALAAAENEARSSARKIWSLPNPLPPWERAPIQAAVERASTGTASAITYHGNTSSKIFHAPSCRYFTCKNCTRTFASRDAAIAAGYRPCKICKP